MESSRSLLFAVTLLTFSALAETPARDLSLFVPASANTTKPAATNVSLSGKVVDTGGNGLYAVIVAYRSSDRVIAGSVNTAFSGAIGTYTLSLPPGTYDFYVRAFGSLPIEDRSVSVQANLARDFTINTSASRAVPPFLTKSRVSSPAVFVNTPQSTSTYTLTATSNLGSTVSLFNEFGSFTVDGQILGTIDLYDDGTHGDAIAGDRVYSRSGFGFNSTPQERCGQFSAGLFLHARISLPVAGIVSVPQVTIIGVKPTTLSTTVIDPLTQYTQYAANLVFDTNEGFQKEAARQFYRKFADIYDFLYFIPERSFGAAGYCQRVRNDVAGIGRPIMDDSAQYGSAGKLRSILLINVSVSPPLLHETMHTWGNDINPPFEAAYLAHWGYAGVNGALGGFDPATLVANADGSFTVPSVAPNGNGNDTYLYAPLELYVAGFVPASAVPSMPVFVAPQIINNDPNHFRGTRTDVSGATIVAAYGPRIPSNLTSPKNFRVAVVGVTSTPLNAASMAYLSILAQQLSGVVPPCIVAQSFSSATAGAGSMDATIQPLGASRRRSVKH